MTGYKLDVVHQTGGGNWTVDATLDAIAGSERPVTSAPFTKVLNGIGAGAITLAPDDPNHDAFLNALAVNWPAREVRLWREGAAAPWWWGVPVRPVKQLGQRGFRQIQLAEWPWLFTRLHFGKTNRTNLLGSNAGFEQGSLTGWSSTGIDSATASGFWKARGDYSAKLVNVGTEDASVQRTISFTSGDLGNVLSIAGHFYIDDWDGPPFANRGLYCEVREAGILLDAKWTRIDEKTPRGTDQRAEIPLTDSLFVPPNTGVTINVRGYSINGTIYWDEFFLGVMESFSSAIPGGSDLATLCAGMVNHAQDTGYDKDDLDIGTGGSATGRKLLKAWQFASHENIWSNGILELVRMEDGIDVAATNGANGRSLRSHSRVGSANGKGADRTAYDMSLSGVNVLDWGHVRDAEQAANSITTLGPGDGPDREEGGYLNLARFGGRALELIQPPLMGATLDQIDQYARQLGAVRTRPSVLNLAMRPGRLVDADELDTGDRVSLPAYDRFVDAGTYRVMDVALNVPEDRVTVGVNPL